MYYVVTCESFVLGGVWIRVEDCLESVYLFKIGLSICFREREREIEREMLEGKALIEDTDMPVKMQIHAMASASQALDLYDVLDCKSIAAHIKKEFDMKYGGGWQCVVGSNFGCFFTHSKGSFIYFTLETLNFLIFKGASSPSSSP